MEENLNKLEQQQQDALERWRIRSERSGLALDKLEGQISVIDDPIGNNLDTVRRQEDSFEVKTREYRILQSTIYLGIKRWWLTVLAMRSSIGWTIRQLWLVTIL